MEKLQMIIDGWSVSLSTDGSTVAIGTPNNDGNGVTSGHVRVYKNVTNVWTQIGSDINGESVGDRKWLECFFDLQMRSYCSHWCIFNDGNGTDSGHVQVYKNIADVWTQIGADIDGS